MVDLSSRIQVIINQYIKSEKYFTINRARQYGKTTLLYLLEKELRKQDYLVLSLSFEAADEYFESLGSLAEGLSLDIEECLREQNVDEKVLEEWNHSISERFPMRSLGTKISNLCRQSDFLIFPWTSKREIFKMSARKRCNISFCNSCRCLRY